LGFFATRQILAAKIIDTSPMKKTVNDIDHYPRRLTPGEVDSLLKDAKESSAWMRTELKRRRSVKSDDLTEKVKR
jgi:hypothetical protein